MKIRKGYVSNSSSSSFVIIMNTTEYNKKYESAHPYVKACLDELDQAVSDNLNITTIEYTTGNYNSFEYINDNIDIKQFTDLPPEYDEWENEYGIPVQGAIEHFEDSIDNLNKLVCRTDM